MATYYRKAHIIYLEDKSIVLHELESINAAKRKSREIQKSGDSVFVIRRKGGRK